MANNYPPGAANDPMAPYNRDDAPEVDVTARETLVKETCILSQGSHAVMEWDIDPDSGRYVCGACYEHDDLKDDFLDQERTASQCLQDCCKVLRQLIKDGTTFYANIYLPTLLSDCKDWEQEEFDVTL